MTQLLSLVWRVLTVKIILGQKCHKNVASLSFECSYPLDYDFCQKNWSEDKYLGTLNPLLWSLLLYILYAKNKSIQKLLHFMVCLGFSRNMSRTNRDFAKTFARLLYMLGCYIRSLWAKFGENRWHWCIIPVWTLQKMTLEGVNWSDYRRFHCHCPFPEFSQTWHFRRHPTHWLESRAGIFPGSYSNCRKEKNYCSTNCSHNLTADQQYDQSNKLMLDLKRKLNGSLVAGSSRQSDFGRDSLQLRTKVIRHTAKTRS